jgi:hypothetical protein
VAPARRKELMSTESILRNTKDSKRAVPTMDISEISANTDARKENKYNEATAATTMLKSMKHRVCLTTLPDNLLRVGVSSTPKANALESIVPMNAAIRETTRSEPSQ